MIDEIKLDLMACEGNGNTIEQIVLSHPDYKVAFAEIKEGETLHSVFGYPTTITPNGRSYIIAISEDNEKFHIEIGGSKPFNVTCE